MIIAFFKDSDEQGWVITINKIALSKKYKDKFKRFFFLKNVKNMINPAPGCSDMVLN